MKLDPHADTASREAHVFARYLVGRPPTPDTLARYGAARHAIWGDAAAAADPLLAFVRRHPWSVAPLDAAASLFQRDGMLHGAILTMAAILETSPQFADQFLPRSVSRASLIAHLVAGGVATDQLWLQGALDDVVALSVATVCAHLGVDAEALAAVVVRHAHQEDRQELTGSFREQARFGTTMTSFSVDLPCSV